MNRNIFGVSKEIKNVISKEINNKEADKFLKSIDKFIENDILYTAPEYQWDVLHNIIMFYYSSCKNENWYMNVLSIFSMKSIEQIKKEIEGE